VLRFTDFLTIDTIKNWFEYVEQLSPFLISLLVIGLLMIDLYLSVPTLAVVILSGYYLGFWQGVLASLIGLLLAGLIGFWLSSKFGMKLIKKISDDEKDFNEMQQLFNSNAKIVLLLCRALPMLPEISSCLAGMNRMPFKQYLLWYLFGTLPYVVIATYSGSLSDINNPWPAIYTAISILGIMSIAWFYVIRKRKITR
jgi:uncharacterized membrane protein YdjX (TVP38/TMEM64 family)